MQDFTKMIKQHLFQQSWAWKYYTSRGLSVPAHEWKSFVSGCRYPIWVVDGDKAPELVGEGPHYETIGGERIRYPNAYSKRGWSNMRYVPSSRRIEVGKGWLAEKLAS